MSDSECEMGVVAFYGTGLMALEGAEMAFTRGDWAEIGPFAAHVPSGSTLRIRAGSRCEILVARVENRSSFEPRLYSPGDVEDEHRGQGVWGGAAHRVVRTIFDRSSAPEQSRLVLGEVVSLPGRWSSYPPHHHPQPEIYYYRFKPRGGYGHAELGEKVYLVRDHDLLRITGSQDHAQVAAPGYQMYYLWAIRHLPDAPYDGFEYNPDHAWLLEEKKEKKL